MKDIKKREMKDCQTAELARIEALRDDCDTFTVVIGSRTAALDTDNEATAAADTIIRDIIVKNFFISTRGKELLKNAPVKISRGKRYGLVGPNGTGKTTMLKLLAWRKIPVLHNIDVLLVEQEVVRDDHTALEAVVAANEELVRLRKETTIINDTGMMLMLMLMLTTGIG